MIPEPDQDMPPPRWPTVSVIIPALNESSSIARCIASVAGEEVSEIIVVDGGSTDDTRRVAASLSAVVIEAPRGRASQMNAGAAVASGDILLFLHADCRIERGGIARLRRLMASGRHTFGYFRQRIDGHHVLFRLIEVGSSLRARWLRRPYGDQAMFVTRTAFRDIGGFPDVPIMEDLYIARTLRTAAPFLPIPAAVVSSARRWHHDGVLRRIVYNLRVALAEQMGTPAAELRRMYERRAGGTARSSSAPCSDGPVSQTPGLAMVGASGSD